MVKNMSEFNQFRREYTRGQLTREQLPGDPMVLFHRWLEEAIASGIPDPNAMTVATVDESGQPSQRIVLLKDIEDGQFVFYTNLGSKKAQDLANNPKISLHFPWHMLERQVKVCGTVTTVSRSKVAEYFFSRPHESQLASIASQQSKPLSAKYMLINEFNKLKEKVQQGQVPLPDFWGGYMIKPHIIEFWQGGEHRLHDRFAYTLQNDQQWQIERLNP